MSSTVERYSGVSRALHWLSALLIFGLFGVGLYMTELDKADPARGDIYGLHKSIGVLTLFLVVARLIWLRIAPAPALPSVFDGKEKVVMKGLQGMLYLLMLLIPISGYVMSISAGHPVSFFGLFQMPALLGESKAVAGFAHEAHEILAWSIIVIVAVHVAGALKHRLKDKGGESDVLARML
jgi:cytochrome b561